jgi:hypothetical protein
MDDTTRQPGGASHPQLSLFLYVAAVIAAIAWPRLAPDAGLFTLLGHATAILWVPFALWAAAEAMLLVAPHVSALAGDARRLAVARLVSGIRLLARCSVWLIPVVAIIGASPFAWWDRATGSLLDLALTVAGVAIFVVVIPRAARHLDRLDPTKVKAITANAGSPKGNAAGSGMVLGHAVSTRTLSTGMLAALQFMAQRGLVMIRAAVRWTRFGIAALDPRFGSDPLATLNATAASVAANRAASAAVGAKAALAGTGSLLGWTIAALRGLAAGNPDKPAIYGPAAIWTERPIVKGAPVLTKREPLKARLWHNDPASAELVELGAAILEASHADALQHGSARGLRGGGMMPPGFEDGPDLTPAEIGKRLILTRAWARPDYFAFILSTAPVVSNDILGRLTAENLAANVAAHSRFTRSQVLAWLHTEHDPDDLRTEVVVDDPARAGVVGTFMVFDRGEARCAAIAIPSSPADEGEDDEDDGSPFSHSPF